MPRARRHSPEAVAVLAAMLEAPNRWTYGYELSKATGLKSGTMYPLLMRLSDQGLLEDGWQQSDSPGRPARHVYRLTPDGVSLASRLVLQQRQGAASARSAEAAT